MARTVKFEKGVEIRKTKGRHGKPPVKVVYITYQAFGVQQRERIGEMGENEADLPFGRRPTIEAAKRLLKKRRQEVSDAREREEAWIPPKERAVIAAEARKPLLFDEASKHFLEECADRYAVPADVRGHHRRLALAFSGRYLDTIKRSDIRTYRLQRETGTGPFAGWPRKVGPRPAQMEIMALSALYGYLEEDYPELGNPCFRPKGKKYGKTKAEAYRPKRSKIIPNEARREAIFKAAEDLGDREMLAFLMLTYYCGGGRPESEVAQVRHGSITLPDEDAASSVLGRVTFKDTKTGEDRKVPVHPAAFPALRGIMLPRPADSDAPSLWMETPLFRRRDGTPWTRQSYRDRWQKIRAHVATQYPEVARMWVRDFRSTATTEMRSQGASASTTAKVQGHSAEMSYRYVEATDEAHEAAILKLTRTKSSTGVRPKASTEAQEPPAPVTIPKLPEGVLLERATGFEPATTSLGTATPNYTPFVLSRLDGPPN